MTSSRSSLLPTISWLRWSLVPALAFIVLCLDRGYQTDFWQHLARGREIVTQGHVLHREPFTATVADVPIRDANWLSQVIYWRLFEWGGLDLVQVVNAFLIAAALFVLVRMCRQVSGSLVTAAGAGVLVFLGLWQILLIRPQTFSLLLFVLLYRILWPFRASLRILVLPPLAMALWANLHGGFAIGLLLIAAFGLAAVVQFTSTGRPRENGPQCGPYGGREAPRIATHPTQIAICYVACFLLSLAATLFNPYGWRVYQSALSITSRAGSRAIEEWMPPNLSLWVGQAFFASLVVLTLLFILARRRPMIREFCLILCFLPLACRSVRMVAWWLLAMAPILSSLLSATVLQHAEDRPARPSYIATALFLLLAGGSVLCLPWLASSNPLFGTVRSNHRTEDDLAALQPDIPPNARIFTRLEWGGYLDFAMDTHRRVFMDGWIELYSDPLWSDYLKISSAQPGWEKSLNRWGMNCLVLDTRYHGQLMSAVYASGDWERKAAAGPAVVFVRRPAASGTIANSCP